MSDAVTDFLWAGSPKPMLSRIEDWTATVTGLGAALTPEALAGWQMGRIRKALARVREKSAFYRENLAGIAIEDVLTPSDLEKLPFTSPGDLLRDPEALLCVSSKEISRVITFRTSGSTAGPKRIYFAEEDLERTVAFFSLGMTTFAEAGQRVVIFFSSSIPGSISDLLRQGIERMGAAAEIHGPVNDPEEAGAAASGADCLAGIPGEMIYLCRTCPELRPKTVLLSMDYAPQSVIEGLEKTWKCRVIPHYGMTEAGYGLALRCHSGKGYHLRHPEIFVEIVDPVTGRRAAPGQEGEVVVTTFSHKAMPLIRYRTGDIAWMDLSSCPCGGVLPRLGGIRGRAAGAISLGGGESIGIQELDEALYSLPEVRNYRADLDLRRPLPTLTLMLDVTAPVPEEPVRRRLQDALGDRLRLELLFGELPLSGGARKRCIHLRADAPR